MCMRRPRVLLNCLLGLTSTLVALRHPLSQPKRQMPCDCLPWLGLLPPQLGLPQALSRQPLKEHRLQLASQPLLKTIFLDLLRPLVFLAPPCFAHRRVCCAQHPLLPTSWLL